MGQSTNKNYKKVEVEWFDAQSSLECWMIDELIKELKPLHTVSCGYLVHENKDYIILAFMIFGNELIKHHQIIPRGMIKKIKVLK